MPVRTSSAIRPRRGDRVKRVGDRDDPGRNGDLIPGQTIWVARPIDPLVVMADDRGEVRITENRNQVRAAARVELDHIELLICERRGFLEDRRRGIELANVVEGGSRADFRDLSA